MADMPDIPDIFWPEETSYPVPFILVDLPIPTAFLPIERDVNVWRTSPGMKEISKKLTILLKHENHHKDWMSFTHLYQCIQGSKRFQYNCPSEDDFRYMLSRYARRYPRKIAKGEWYYKMDESRHPPHEDPP